MDILFSNKEMSKEVVEEFILELDKHERVLAEKFKKLGEAIKSPFIDDMQTFIHNSEEFKYIQEYHDKLWSALTLGYINIETYSKKLKSANKNIDPLFSIAYEIGNVSGLQSWVKKMINRSTPEELEAFKQKLEGDLIFWEDTLPEQAKKEHKIIIKAIIYHQQNSEQTKKSATKLEWTGQINQLSDLFRDLMFVKNDNGETFINPTSIADLKHFIMNNFVHKPKSRSKKGKPKSESKPISEESLNTYLKRDEDVWKTNVKKNKRLLAQFFYKD